MGGGSRLTPCSRATEAWAEQAAPRNPVAPVRAGDPTLATMDGVRIVSREGHDPASLLCAAARPEALIRSSRTLCWTHVLLDHHRGVGRSDTFQTHPTADVALMVAISGRCTINVQTDRRWRSALYEPGAAGLTAPLGTPRMNWMGEGRDKTFDTLHAYVSGALVREIAEEFRRVGAQSLERPLNALVFRDPTVAKTVVALERAMQGAAPDLYVEQLCRFLGAHLLSRHSGWWDPDAEARSPGLINDRRLARVVDYMSSRLSEPMTLADLAAEAGISVHHFVRLFRRQTGLTPYAYLARLRMEAATRLLKTTDLPVSELARLCGFSSPSAFAAAFARYSGVSPRVYRRERGLVPI